MRDMAELVLVRHGQTAWSREGKHTGHTDVPLTDQGEADALALRPRLESRAFGLVLTSPLQRAARTAELAGLQAEPEDDLIEWDYGPEEGRTTAQARETRPGWTVWDDVGMGEKLAQVAERQQRVLARVRQVLAGGADACLVGHGHSLRIVGACWIGLPPVAARNLSLNPSSISTMGFEHDIPAILTWNT